MKKTVLGEKETEDTTSKKEMGVERYQMKGKGSHPILCVACILAVDNSPREKTGRGGGSGILSSPKMKVSGAMKASR